MREKDRLLNGDIKNIFLRYLFPSIGGMLGTSLYVLGDTMIVGRYLGGQGLAALSISIPLINVFNGFGLLFGIGGATAVSINRGQGKGKNVNSIFNLSMAMSLVVGIILSLIRVFFLDELVLFLGATDYTFEMARSYLGVLMSFSIAFLLNSSLTVFIRNDGSPKLAMVAMLTGSIINVVLDYIFIVPMGLGMWGGALATGLSPVIGLLILSIHFIKKKNNISFEKIKIKKDLFLRIIRNGLASFIIELSAGIVIFAFNIVILGIIGDIGVSAYSIIANLSLICTAIFTGIGQAIQPIVSINHGAGNKERTLKALKLGNITALIFGLIFFLSGQLIPDKLYRIFSKERGGLMALTVRGIRLYFIAFLVMGINIVMTSYIQSKENRRVSTAISLLRGFVFLLVSLLLLARFFSIDGVWLTMPVAEVLTFVSYMILFKECREGFKYTFKLDIKV